MDARCYQALSVSLAVIEHVRSARGSATSKNKRPTNRGRGHGTLFESVYHPNQHGDDSSAQHASCQCPVRPAPSANQYLNAPQPPHRLPSSIRRRATKTPPAKGQAGSQCPVRSVLMAGRSSPSHRNSGFRGGSDNNTRINIPPLNLRSPTTKGDVNPISNTNN
jgi:hypothetical protein